MVDWPDLRAAVLRPDVDSQPLSVTDARQSRKSREMRMFVEAPDSVSAEGPVILVDDRMESSVATSNATNPKPSGPLSLLHAK